MIVAKTRMQTNEMTIDTRILLSAAEPYFNIHNFWRRKYTPYS